VPTDPIDPVERLIRNTLLVQRIGTSVHGGALPLLYELFEQIGSDLASIDPTAPSAQRWRDFRTDEVLSEVESRAKEAFTGWERQIRGDLARAGRQQGEFAEQLLVASLGDAGSRVTKTPITQQRVRAILNSQPFEGALLREWSQGLEATTVRRVRQQVRLGMTNEETLDEIVRRVRGRHSGGFTSAGRPVFQGGVWGATTRDAQSVVRSAVSFVNAESHMETYKANERFIETLVFTATLDERTSDICSALDGQQWAIDDPDIRRPGINTHFGGCRSDLVPAIDYAAVGLPEPPEGERAARDLTGISEEDLRRKISARRRTGDLGGQARVPSSTRYAQWLRNQPERVQNRAIGVGKARLFREGKISLSDLIRDDLTHVPLSELLERAG
jgi:SPP1 gp7 family putative phage head morphogenesis protein